MNLEEITLVLFWIEQLCTQWRHKSKKSEMFMVNVADKYASVVTKKMSLGCNYWSCSAGHFFNMHLPFMDSKIAKIEFHGFRWELTRFLPVGYWYFSLFLSCQCQRCPMSGVFAPLRSILVPWNIPYFFCSQTMHCRFLVPDNTQKILWDLTPFLA